MSSSPRIPSEVSVEPAPPPQPPSPATVFAPSEQALDRLQERHHRFLSKLLSDLGRSCAEERSRFGLEIDTLRTSLRKAGRTEVSPLDRLRCSGSKDVVSGYQLQPRTDLPKESLLHKTIIPLEADALEAEGIDGDAGSEADVMAALSSCTKSEVGTASQVVNQMLRVPGQVSPRNLVVDSLMAEGPTLPTPSKNHPDFASKSPRPFSGSSVGRARAPSPAPAPVQRKRRISEPVIHANSILRGARGAVRASFGAMTSGNRRNSKRGSFLETKASSTDLANLHLSQRPDKVAKDMINQQTKIASSFRARERRRLRMLFGLRPDDRFVSSDVYLQGLLLRCPHAKASVVSIAVDELRRFGMSPSRSANVSQYFEDTIECPEDAIPFNMLLNLVLEHDNVMQTIRPEALEPLREAFLPIAVCHEHDLIGEATWAASGLHNSQAIADGHPSKLWAQRLQMLVVTAVVVSLVSMGYSIDHDPSHWGWLLVECFCATIFIVEVIMKIRWFGMREYFLGEDMSWNIGDFIITIFAFVEVILSISLEVVSADTLGGTGMAAKALQTSLVCRLFRVVRLVRLLKLVRSPIMRDLANMLVGFIVGMPSLLWVIGLLCMLIFASGIIFRHILGPLPGQDLSSSCGDPDYILEDGLDDGVCKVHYLYGEEYFGTVAKSMFTAFRFMLGDYSTLRGKSMAAALSKGYGWTFDLAFVVSMLIMTFGCFNIITAIFVDSTISGLRHNDTKRKFERQYERSWVRDKLTAIITRIKEMHLCSNEGGQPDDDLLFDMDEEAFNRVMQDPKIQTLLQDLDVQMFNPLGNFDIFDPNGDGIISLDEFVKALMKLRGDPQKGDIISSCVSLRSLHEKIDQFQVLMLSTREDIRCNNWQESEELGGG